MWDKLKEVERLEKKYAQASKPPRALKPKKGDSRRALPQQAEVLAAKKRATKKVGN